MTPEILPVDASLRREFESFFDINEPGCFCRWPRYPPLRFDPEDPSHREAMGNLIASGTCPGLLAFVDREPVGWCAVGPLSAYPQYRDVARPKDAWGIACVTVNEAARGKGVGHALIEAGVAHARERGGAWIYGPPPWWQPRAEDAAPGLVRIFQAAGFRQVGAGARIPILRKRLR